VKAYENYEVIKGYRESDPMGGFDPYSSSKGCSELLTSSFRNSYFNIDMFKKNHNTLLASCRAGNVIGGGDWAKDRLIPDVVESISNGKSVTIRNPSAVRPWQHVLEPLSGYLLLGQKLLNEEVNLAQAWNFGPDNEGVINVEQILAQVQQYWNHLKYYVEHNDNQPHEASYLALDCTKANKELNWRPVWNIQETIKHTIGWYKQYYLENKVVTDDDISSYVNRAKELKISWTD